MPELQCKLKAMILCLRMEQIVDGTGDLLHVELTACILMEYLS